MVSKTIAYKDFNGIDRTETFWFNLNETELTMMEASPDGGSLSAYLDALSKSPKPNEVMDIFIKIITAAYGVKSPDGRRFMKKVDGHNLYEEFIDTPAFNQMFMEFVREPEKMAAFINAVVDVKLDNATGPVMING